MEACCLLGMEEFILIIFQVKFSHDPNEQVHISELKPDQVVIQKLLVALHTHMRILPHFSPSVPPIDMS